MALLNLGDTTYPTTKDTMTPLVDGTDEIIVSHFNGPANAIVAIETELGTGLKGTLADLATRLNVNISTEGGLLYGAAFPTSPSNTAHFFWRTDLQKAYIYNTDLATYTELPTSVSLADYLSKTVGATITAVHQFNPAVAGAPFTIGANATGQRVSGLNADMVDGKQPSTPSGLATTDANSRVVESANLVWDTVAGRAASPTEDAYTIPVRDASGVLPITKAIIQYINYVKVSEVQTSGTNAGGFTSGSYVTRVINTEDSDTAGICTIASNQITLAVGTYRCHIAAPAYQVASHKALLYNITDSAVVLYGQSAHSNSAYPTQTHSFIVGEFTIASQKTFEVRHQCETTKANTGLGVAANFGDEEVYTIAQFWRMP